jgi:hypothetical protein
MFHPASSHFPLSQVQVASSAQNFHNTLDLCTAGSKVKFVNILRNMYVVDSKQQEGKWFRSELWQASPEFNLF